MTASFLSFALTAPDRLPGSAATALDFESPPPPRRAGDGRGSGPARARPQV